MKQWPEGIERGIERCTRDVLVDQPLGKGYGLRHRWETYKWHRRWRKTEYNLFVMGGMYGSVNWVILKETLERIGGFW